MSIGIEGFMLNLIKYIDFSISFLLLTGLKLYFMKILSHISILENVIFSIFNVCNENYNCFLKNNSLEL